MPERERSSLPLIDKYTGGAGIWESRIFSLADFLSILPVFVKNNKWGETSWVAQAVDTCVGDILEMYDVIV